MHPERCYKTRGIVQQSDNLAMISERKTTVTGENIVMILLPKPSPPFPSFSNWINYLFVLAKPGLSLSAKRVPRVAFVPRRHGERKKVREWEREKERRVKERVKARKRFFPDIRIRIIWSIRFSQLLSTYTHIHTHLRNARHASS